MTVVVVKGLRLVTVVMLVMVVMMVMGVKGLCLVRTVTQAALLDGGF